MSTQGKNWDQEIVTRYTGQPARMPADVRRLIESEWATDSAPRSARRFKAEPFAYIVEREGDGVLYWKSTLGNDL